MIALILSSFVLFHVDEIAPHSGYSEMLSVPLAVMVLMLIGELIGRIAEGGKRNKAAPKNAVGYCYFDCPNCKQKFRVPVGKGKVKVTCPHCQRKYETTT